MKTHTTELPFFSTDELECPCCGTLEIDVRFAAVLPYLRHAWGAPLKVNSVCRCPEHNTRVHGHPSSLHLTENKKWGTAGCMAADVSWWSWPKEEKVRFARLAHHLGLRVGLHNAFCHVDLGRALGLSATPFVYGQWSNEFTPEEVL